MKITATVDFLSDDRILKSVRELCEQEHPLLQIAVSYWGQGALSGSGILERVEKNAESIKVICDIDSPGCNPEPIQQLVAEGVEVKTLENFHAKVWIGHNVAIVGSANVSLYGLGFGGVETSQTKVEAAVLIQNDKFVSLVQNWFRNLWEHSAEVTPKRADSALNTWLERSVTIKNSRSFKRSREVRTERDKALPKERKERYRAFFDALLSSLRKKGYPLGKNLKAKPANRLNIGAGSHRISYFARFTKDRKRVCIELFIGTRDKEWNKRKFDEIRTREKDIENELGETLSWERDDDLQKSSIVLYRNGKINDEDAKLDEINAWMVKRLFTFHRVFHQYIE